MKLILSWSVFFCCSRLDCTTCYSRRFNYTEFPWAIQMLTLVQVRAEASPPTCIFSAYTSTFWSIEFMHLSALFPSAAFGRGCHFPWKLGVKNKGQMLHFTPRATPTKGVQCPQNTEVLIPWVWSSVCSQHNRVEERALALLQCFWRLCFIQCVWNSVIRV